MMVVVVVNYIIAILKPLLGAAFFLRLPVWIVLQTRLYIDKIL